ncbi:hypothetical protein [Rhizobium sp. No.120]
MKADKLRNLLQEMEKRLIRVEKSVLEIDGSRDGTHQILQQLITLKSEVRRLLSKVDSLRVDGVAKLETQIEELREVARRTMSGHLRDDRLITVMRAIALDNLGLLNLSAGLKIGLNQIGPKDVLEATPGQKTAAFKFAFEKEVLAVVDQPIKPHEREKDIAFAALETAFEHGEYVNRDLAGTNASPRLRDAFLRLQSSLASNRNIVQVGANAQICNRLVNADVGEMSSALFGLLIGHIEMVFAALSQFEEWRIYCENAMSLHLDIGTIAKMTENTLRLAEQLRETEAADPSVADALETVTGWVSDQTPPDKRDVFSLVRTVENIWSSVTRRVLSFGGEIASEAKKQAAKALLAVLIAGAAGLVPIVSKVPGAQWIETAYTFFKASAGQPPSKSE